MSDQDLDKWCQEIDEEFWGDPEEVRLFEEWLEEVYNNYYNDEDDREGPEKSFIPKQPSVNIENEELPF